MAQLLMDAKPTTPPSGARRGANACFRTAAHRLGAHNWRFWEDCDQNGGVLLLLAVSLPWHGTCKKPSTLSCNWSSPMKKILAASASLMMLAGAAQAQTAAPAAPAPEWTVAGNVSLNSDYRFRGFTQTNYGAALQGGIDITHSSGFYVGTARPWKWTSTVASRAKWPLAWAMTWVRFITTTRSRVWTVIQHQTTSTKKLTTKNFTWV
ncbi:MAG: hypothetical protein EB096_09205 [Betaproteobacteria bacterium]|nr:hypothetical protein [Betaproteobacteria bacterium]